MGQHSVADSRALEVQVQKNQDYEHEHVGNLGDNELCMAGPVQWFDTSEPESSSALMVYEPTGYLNRDRTTIRGVLERMYDSSSRSIGPLAAEFEAELAKIEDEGIRGTIREALCLKLAVERAEQMALEIFEKPGVDMTGVLLPPYKGKGKGRAIENTSIALSQQLNYSDDYSDLSDDTYDYTKRDFEDHSEVGFANSEPNIYGGSHNETGLLSRNSRFYIEMQHQPPAANYTSSVDVEQSRGLSVTDLKKSMEQHGYCRHQIDHLAETYDLYVLERFAWLDRRQARNEDHSHCSTKDRCIAYDSPKDRPYTMAHTKDCHNENCYTVETPQNDLIRIVKGGGVPLIFIHEENNRASIKVHARRFNTKYATISHVWADGLGNQNQNALPVCQIRRLKRVTNWLEENEADFEEPTDFDELQYFDRRERRWGKEELTEDKSILDMFHDTEASLFNRRTSGLLWMDTLCIPPLDNQLRGQCIDNMASIYAGSSSVFIFDKELSQTPLPQYGQERPVAHLYKIACSVWMCRSWTLQEAVLPPERIFEFADGFFRPKSHRVSLSFASMVNGPDLKFARTLFDSVLDPLQRSVRRDKAAAEYPLGMQRLGQDSPPDEMELATFSRDWMSTEVERMERCSHFVSVWNELAGRGTTLPADLYIVLAVCLNFKLKQFLKLQTIEEKMQNLLFSFETLPLSLFFNSGERINNPATPYNRWVPTMVKSYLTHGSTFSFPSHRISAYSDQATLLTLHLESDVSTLIVDEELLLRQDFVIADENNLYRIHAMFDSTENLSATLVSECISTCIILENRSHCEKKNHRGACFFISKGNPSAFDKDGRWTLEMTYFCPVTITKQARSEILQEADVQFQARLVQSSSIFRVRYNPILDFKPLKRDDRRSPFKRLKKFERAHVPDEPGELFGLFVVAYGILYSCAVTYVFVSWDGWVPEDGGLLGFLEFSVILLTLVALLFTLSPFLAYLTFRGCHYLFEYGSFDEDTVLDRLKRSPGLIWSVAILYPWRLLWTINGRLFSWLDMRKESPEEASNV